MDMNITGIAEAGHGKVPGSNEWDPMVMAYLRK